LTVDGNTTLGDAAADVATITGQLTASLGGLIPDDQALHFDTDADSHIKYRESDDNYMVISGSALNTGGGLVLSGANIVFDAPVKDDKKLYFGDGSDAFIEYRETSDNYMVISGSALNTGGGLVLSGANVVFDAPVKDDKKLYFGDDSDAFVEYRETGDNYMVVSGSSAGLALSGSTIIMDAPDGVWGHQFYWTHHAYRDTGTAKIYIPLNSTVEVSTTYFTTSNFMQAHWIAPFGGRLVKVMVHAQGVTTPGTIHPGSTVVGLHINKNTTAIETQTEDLENSTTATFYFTGDAVFSSGNTLAISIDPTNTPNDTLVVCVWGYDTRT